MRVTEDRYSRDLRRINLAVRLIAHEARTQTICAWTGLSDERVRSLCRSYVNGQNSLRAVRHRGPAPRRLAVFLRSPQMRSEAAALAVLCRLNGAIPDERVANAVRTLPSVSCGERVCAALEIFRGFVPDSPIMLEQVLLLVTALAQGDELEMGNCANCNATILIDPLGATRRTCSHCCRHAGSRAADEDVADESPAAAEDSGSYQQDLF